MSSGNFASTGTSWPTPDHGVHALARPERVLELVRVGRERVAQKICEQELSESAPGLRRAQRLLQPGEVLCAVEHLRRGSVELAQALNDLGRRLAGALLRREQPAVEALEPAVDAGVELAEPPVEPVLDRPERAHERRAQNVRDTHQGEQEQGCSGDPHGTAKR